MEIAQAISAAQRGDRQAFYQIYRQFTGRVYAICWRLLADKQKAEDATQEVFIKIWQQLPDFRGDSQFGTWLHTIATRTAIDIWRQEKFLRLTDSTDDSNSELAEQVTEAVTDDTQLEAAILRLPAQARAVFVLFAIEGYQHQQIAVLLDIAEGTSKAQYHRARQLLREWLSED